MRTLLLTIITLTLSFIALGQSPEGFKYQAVIRDAGNLTLTDQAVGMQLSIQQGSIGGTSVYTETFSITTNAYGLVNLEIGTGLSTDDFSMIDWANGPYFMETAVDLTGGMTYEVMGTSQLMSVPYALYAKTSGNGEGPQGPAGAGGVDGAPGPQGFQGAIGANGINGINGLDGVPGSQGEQGIQGMSGNDGVAGINGQNGAVGATGPQGPQGNLGSSGDDGVDGVDGSDGANGSDGNDGSDGAVGATGPQGPQGNLGSSGDDGIDGSDGANGSDGNDGSDGAVGATGPQGPQGNIGSSGDDGVDGIDGSDGANGSDGNDGSDGAVGATGSQGPQGNIGSSGDDGVDGIDGSDGANGSDGNDGSDGAVGATGPQGPQGNIGSSGDDGIDGTNGSDGNDGVGIAQTLLISGDTLFISSGNYILIPGLSLINSLIVNGCTDPTALNYNASATTDDGSCTYLAIGDTHQGGIVFYLDGNGGGLIAAPTDQPGYAEWGCYLTNISGAEGTAIGTGAQNTIDIEAGCTTSGTAADICANLTLGGYSDWFLPSKDELNLMWLNIGQGNALGLGNLGGFSLWYYWSSTELGFSFAWEQSFGNGSQSHNVNSSTLLVRAVRAF
jgi:hypothetical protein